MTLQDVECARCGSDDDVELVGRTADGRIEIRCRACDLTWIRGTPKEHRLRQLSLAQERARFPGRGDVAATTMVAVEQAKAAFLSAPPVTDPAVGPYSARYQQVFSEEGLRDCDPQDLKDFATSAVGADPGNQSVFGARWDELGEAEAVRRTRATLQHLLHGPATQTLEDRLTDLLLEQVPFAMPGFGEALLTRALWVTQPERFLPLLAYTCPSGGKREIAQAVYGLRFPSPKGVTWTLGRLVVWSNDVLVDLLGPGFADTSHASAFLWQQWSRRPATAPAAAADRL